MRTRSFLALVSCLCFSVALNAQRYSMTGRIPMAGKQDYWDYLVADGSGHRLYVTRLSEVQVLDLRSEKQIATIPNLKRVHGIALAKELNKGFLTDGGDNAVVVFDLKSNSVTQKIKVGDAPDAVLYEPTKKRVYAFNAHSRSASVIDAETEKVINTIPLSGTPEFAVTDGKGTVYVNIETKNSLVRFDPDGMKVQNEWSLAPCEEPSGLAMDTQGRRLFSVCTNKMMVVTDADTGKQITQIAVGEEPDAAAFDAGKKLVFSSNSDATLTVVKQESPDKYSVVQNVQTEMEARTMALDSVSHKIYLDCADLKPGPPKKPNTLPPFEPGTFRLLVVAPQI